MSPPNEMNAVSIDRFGGPEVLNYGRRPIPQVAAGQVLVKIGYAAVGTWDPLMRDGLFAELAGEMPPFPLILGTDGSGTIAAVGPGVDRVAVGDEVYLVGGGLYTDYVAIDADAVSRLPGGLTLEQAGAMPVVALTALHGLADELAIEPGQTVLIKGASGDAGHIAVQLARLMGARVLAVASGADGVQAAQDLGSDVAVDGRTTDIAAAAKAFAPEGLDAVLAFIGGPGLDAAVSAVREGGRVAWPLGVEPAPQPRAGVHFHQFDLTHDAPAAVQARMTELNELIAPGPFEVRVAGSYPLARAAEAHQALERHRIGKIVLTTSGS